MECWDGSDLCSWLHVQTPVRVIRSRETYTVRRQLDRQPQLLSSEWIWVTTAPAAQLPTQRAIIFGHLRWDIENYAFNELAHEWHSDHVFRHDPNAIECFLLLTFLAYNRPVSPCPLLQSEPSQCHPNLLRLLTNTQIQQNARVSLVAAPRLRNRWVKPSPPGAAAVGTSG